jgi:hypothetical protein
MLQATQAVCCVPFCGKPLYDDSRCEVHSRRMQQRLRMAEIDAANKRLPPARRLRTDDDGAAA